MQLLELGHSVIGQSFEKKHRLANQLIRGEEDITKYMRGVCYDTVAFTRYLQYYIPPFEKKILTDTHAQGWLKYFKFEQGVLWKGNENIIPGVAIGFRRILPNQSSFFHAAISTGGKKIRGVNGLTLGAAWDHLADLDVLKKTDKEGAFIHDNAKTEVYLSRF